MGNGRRAGRRRTTRPSSQSRLGALAASVLEELGRLGVTVTLDGDGRARFRSVRIPPLAARLEIERHGPLIEAYLSRRSAVRSRCPDRPHMRALNLYCGAGGAVRGVKQASFHVVGVDPLQINRGSVDR